MKNQERIDQVLKKILTGRKLTPEMITAYSHVIASLSQVKDKEESPNEVKADPVLDDLLQPTVADLKNISQINVDGTDHPIKIYS